MEHILGIYDIIYSQYDLGPGMWNRELRTQDLQGYMDNFWIDPSGQFWSIDYSGTYDFEDQGCIKIVRSMNNGRVTPYFLTKQIELYPAKWGVHYAPTPRCMVTFNEGKVVNSFFS
jgi:hypothetical protein|tara:strand:+ start:177 stop:524 length:348 start_codon:yes stop_codon:yes gene_type:complete